MRGPEGIARQLRGAEAVRFAAGLGAGELLQQRLQHAGVLRRFPTQPGAREAIERLADGSEVRRTRRRRGRGAHGADTRALALAAVGDEAGGGAVARPGRRGRPGGEQPVAVGEQQPRPCARAEGLRGNEALHTHRRALRAYGRGQRVEDRKPFAFIEAARQFTAHEGRHLSRAVGGDERLHQGDAGGGLLGSSQQHAGAVPIPARQGGEAGEVLRARAASRVGRGEDRLDHARGQRDLARVQRALGTSEHRTLVQRRGGDGGERPVQRGHRFGAGAAARAPFPLQHQRVVRPPAARMVREHRLRLDRRPGPRLPRLDRFTPRFALRPFAGQALGAPHPVVVDAGRRGGQEQRRRERGPGHRPAPPTASLRSSSWR